MTETDRIAQLEACAGKLGADRDRSFAGDLVRQFNERGRLSMKQWEWVDRLTRRAGTDCAEETARVENLSPLVDMFDRAGAKLRYPKIKLSSETSFGAPLELGRAGEKARFPGSVNVTNGGPFGSSIFYGRVGRDGTFVPSRDCPKALVEFLAELSRDAADVVGSYGRKTGGCAMCSRPLTDPRSVEVGYGPVCADRFGLPWGELARAA